MSEAHDAQTLHWLLMGVLYHMVKHFHRQQSRPNIRRDTT